MAPTATFYYSALDFGITDYTPVQNKARTKNDPNVKSATWMVPLYSKRDRNTKRTGWITWDSAAYTKADGKLAVSERLGITTGNKTMTLVNGFTNINGYYQVGEKHRALLTQGSLSPEANKPFKVSNKKYVTIEKTEDRQNWRKVVLSTTVPN